MKLKLKFSLIIVGFVLLPFFAAYIVGFIYLQTNRRNGDPPGFYHLGKWVDESFYPALDRGVPSDALSDIPSHLQILLFDESGKVAVSTIAAYPEGAHINVSDVLSALSEIHQNHSISLNAVTDKSGAFRGKIITLMRTRGERWRPGPLLRLKFSLIFLSFIFLSSIAGGALASSMRRSLIRLQRAAVAVGGGDYDIKLTITGNDEIARLTEAFNAMGASLKEETERRARFLTAVSHDLSTPLASIQGYIEALADDIAKTPEERKKFISIIAEKTKILERRIADLLEFAKLKTGEWRLKYDTVEMADFLEGIARTFAQEAHILRRRFEGHIDIPKDCFIVMDRFLFTRAFEILFANMLRFTSNSEPLLMSVRIENKDILVSLEGAGFVIPENELPLIFEPFYRSDHFNKELGFGLGFSSVKTIVETHGFRISTASGPLGKISFVIRIPKD